ncbi:mycofactocin biosynthesis glycosyltransferase MftF [Nocardioides sp. LS1]|uniref:mycofactocin biosynthesis glycosyltransferase MftF n=1 Tax=Nocardioides sp. LS1 TaxID=1027620 RepID=UPI000F6172FE|nr:mycofactocin biosynthesis glycosyltransferase MftF [Nocardioides sp. LS1]GCD91094.1 putative mycofactocin biosynthesis glycosyltransferase MftF [Nocardioides sp. LS1]
MSKTRPVSQAGRALPDGHTVRIRSDVARAGDGQVLVGGSPLRAIRLSERARSLVDGDEVRVSDDASRLLAARLLDANIADPVLDDVAPPTEDLTVVIPLRDRAEQLDRCLAALTPLRCIVVDDASHDRAAVAAVAARHGAHLVSLPENLGPGGARNAGLPYVATAYVAFVDSDVQVSPETLVRLARHFRDPAVALVGPLVRSKSRSVRPRWFERYDEHASSLALGTRACSVRPGAAVGWLPGACLVARVSALGDGFTASMRVGEDVDLVWRLTDAGHVVRYDPGETADHDARPTIRTWLGRKYVYGTGGAPLAVRYPGYAAPAVLPPTMAIGAAALLLRRRWSLPVALATLLYSRHRLARTLPDTHDRGQLATRLALRGLGWGVRQESGLLLRHWWPPVALLALVSSSVRRALVTAALVDIAVERWEHGDLDPATTFLGRRIDDLAYGGGLWIGALRHRDLGCVSVRLTRV